MKILKAFYILPIMISVCLSSTANAVPTTESFHQWLQGAWGQVKEDGSAVSTLIAKGCDGLYSDIPKQYVGKLNGRSILKKEFFGDLAFSSFNGAHVVLSAFPKSPKGADILVRLRYAEGAAISSNLIADQDGYMVLEMQSLIPGLKHPRVITPRSNDMFRLEGAVENGKPVYGTTKYFKRCK